MNFLIKSKTDFKNVDDVLIRIIVEYQKRFSRSIGVDGKTTTVKWNFKSATYIGKVLPNYLAREILDDTWIDEIDNNIWQITQN